MSLNPILRKLLLTLALVSTLPACAQQPGAWEKVYSALMALDTANAHGHATPGFDPAIMAIPGKPFTAKRTFTDQRLLNGVAVGDPVTAEFTIARDSYGRVHYEMAFESSRAGKDAIGGLDIQINDPIAHRLIRYFANADHSRPPQPIAEIRKLELMSVISKPLPPSPPPQESTDDASSAPAMSNVPDASSSDKAPAPAQKVQASDSIQFLPTKDNLPVQSIDGIKVVIHRTILKYGPKQQMFQIQENWLSPEFALDMREIILRETIGKQTIETRDIIEGEPDPSLFAIPAGYVAKYVR